MIFLRETVAQAFRRHGLAQPGQAVLVAVSGGADSVALLGVLRDLAASWDFRLHVAHLNHGLRAEAAADAAFVQALAATWALPVTADAADVRRYACDRHLSLEAAAREVRYAFLARAAAGAGCRMVAVGHTADDQAETFLLRLLRGGRPGGMWPRREVSGVTVIRPLLDVWRRDLRAWLQARGLPWREDQTNADRRHLRNRVRHDLIPLLAGHIPEARKRLKYGADLLAEEDAALEEGAGAVEAIVMAPHAPGVRVDRAALRAQPVALRSRLLRRAVGRAGGNIGRLRFVLWEEILRLAEEGENGRRLSLPGVDAEIRGGDLVLAPRSERPGEEYVVPLEGCVEAPPLGVILESEILPAGAANLTDGAAYLDADKVRRPLLLRAWRPGDRFRPLGLRGVKKVGDFLTDAKAPRLLRSRIPVLQAADGTILWLVGWRVAEDARVTAETRRVVRLRARPIPGAGDAVSLRRESVYSQTGG